MEMQLSIAEFTLHSSTSTQNIIEQALAI